MGLPRLHGAGAPEKGVYKEMIERLKLFTQQIGYKRIVAGVFNANKASKRAHQKSALKPYQTSCI